MDVRWMVFKVKQRAEKSYYNTTISSQDDAFFKTNLAAPAQKQVILEPDYTYNWPYDFFSLVELAKIQSTIKLGGDKPHAPIVPKPSPPKIEKGPSQGGPPLEIPPGYIPPMGNMKQQPGDTATVPGGLNIGNLSTVIASMPGIGGLGMFPGGPGGPGGTNRGGKL